MSDILTATSPIQCPTQSVLEEWIDYNGHMNMAFYNVAFDRGVDHVYDLLNIGPAYVERGGSVFTMEVHLHYLQELELGAPIDIRFQLLDADEKRLHFFQEMYHGEEGFLAATSEQLALHVDMNERRSGPFPAGAWAMISKLKEAHAGLPRPEQVGSVMGIRRKKTG